VESKLHLKFSFTRSVGDIAGFKPSIGFAYRCVYISDQCCFLALGTELTSLGRYIGFSFGLAAFPAFPAFPAYAEIRGRG